MQMTKKEIRKLSHKKALKMHFKGLITGTIIFALPQILLAVLGILNLWAYIFNCLLFLFLQGLIYHIAYKFSKSIVINELKL